MRKRLAVTSLIVILLVLAGEALARQFGCDSPNCSTAVPNAPAPSAPDGAGTPDRDGDGVPDYVDPCPDAVGSGYTNGCPVEEATPVPSMPIFPLSEDCLLGSVQPANIRQSTSTRDPVIGQLRSGDVVQAIFRTTNPSGETWYFTDAGGYIRSDVVGTNGNCGELLRVNVQPQAAVLHITDDVLRALQGFPLQQNLNTLNRAGSNPQPTAPPQSPDASPARRDGIGQLVYVTLTKAQNANDEALAGADRQRDLIAAQNSARAAIAAYEEALRAGGGPQLGSSLAIIGGGQETDTSFAGGDGQGADTSSANGGGQGTDTSSASGDGPVTGSPTGSLDGIAYLIYVSQMKTDLANEAAMAGADKQRDAIAAQNALRELLRDDQERVDELGNDQNIGNDIEVTREPLYQIMLVQQHGSATDCPMFTKWVEYPAAITDQLEYVTPVELDAPCVLEILYADEQAQTISREDGSFGVVLNSILIEVNP
jgi:hypothetical protein